jgi:predicted GTPase
MLVPQGMAVSALTSILRSLVDSVRDVCPLVNAQCNEAKFGRERLLMPLISQLCSSLRKPFFKRTADEWSDWSHTKDRLGQQLKNYYQAYTTEELPPRLRALIKKLDEEFQPENQPEIVRDIEN